ncbi:transposable element Tcb1 transposase [Trichonephila clavipes]|nr:transposable element Tcb1 transposase [Trichonephila clavipes]
MSRRKQRSAFDQVSEFDRGRIVAYQDCGLYFREIGSRVGRNQTTVMRICDRWKQEGTMDRRGRSPPPQCTTSHEHRQIVRMAVTDRLVTSRTVAQHIESVTHHSVSARTIRRRLQQSGLSARRPLLGLPLKQNHRRLRRQWYDERRMWAAEWNEVVFTDESRICLQHHDGRIRVWRHRGERMLNSCVMHRHTCPAPGIMIWGGIGYPSRIPLVRIAGTLNSPRYISEVVEPVVLLYLQGLATAIFQEVNA